MIAIIDYGSGNLRSVANAIARVGYQSTVTSDPADILSADAVIFPGVGAAGETMQSLRKLGMAEAIQGLVFRYQPLFAICVGMQVLFSATEERGRHECLGIVPGIVRRLPERVKTPHMGWNQVKQNVRHPIFQDIPDEANFYFVHSYYADPENPSTVAGTTEYGVRLCSVIARGNLVATQFHPEKSGEHGLRMYANFLRMALGNTK